MIWDWDIVDEIKPQFLVLLVRYHMGIHMQHHLAFMHDHVLTFMQACHLVVTYCNIIYTVKMMYETL